MPLLGRRNHTLAKPLKDKKPDEPIYVIDFTKEEFRSKEEYKSRLKLYGDNVWTCQCTGKLELTYQEAQQSERRAHRQLNEHFPVYFEKSILEIVHHNTIPLENLVDKSHQHVHAIFAEGEPVELTVKVTGKILKGKVAKVLKLKEDEQPSHCSSPSSDKENSESSSSGASSPKKDQINKHLYKYSVELSNEGKIVSFVPAADLKRANRTPNKDLIKLFIRAHAVRAGTNPNSPWIVEDNLVKKYSLPSKFAEFLLAPKKVSPDGGLGKRKSISSTSRPAKKAKMDPKTKNKTPGKSNKKSSNPKESSKKKSSPKLVSSSLKKLASPGKSPKKSNSANAKQSDLTSSSSESDSDSDFGSMPLIFFKRMMDKQKGKADLSSNASSPKKGSGSSRNSTPLSSPKKKDARQKIKADSKQTRKKKDKGGKVTEKKRNKEKKNSKSPKKATPKKSPRKNASGTQKSRKVQVTLFDIAKKKGLKVEKKGTPSPMKPPKSPRSPRQPMIARRLEKAKKDQNKTLYQHLVSRAVRELSMQRISAIRDNDIRMDVQKKFEARMERIKWKMMTPAEREKAMQEKKAQRKQQAKLDRQKKLEDEKKLRQEKARRYEDQELQNLKVLPIPKLVQLPERLPNTLFGDIAMVVEFISCYAELLMPDDPYPVTAECLMKALVNGKEGFGYLSRVLVILLQTLLQDGIAEDYRELGCAVSDIPVNMYTSSEIVRLCLRLHDEEIDRSEDSDDEEMIEDNDVEPQLIEKLENCEYFDLEPQDKLQIMVGLCHRIMSSFSVQDFMEEKQNVAAKLARAKRDQDKAVKKKKKEERDAAKQKKDDAGQNDGKEEHGEKKEEEQKDKEEKKKGKKLPDKSSPPPPPPPVKKEDKEEDLPPEDDNDLASIVKRRRILAAREKAAKLEQERLDKERRQKEYEEYKKQKAENQQERAFEEGTNAAKLSLRQMPIGTDRNHSRYWVFSHVVPSLFVEKGWIDSCVEYCVQTSIKEEKEDTSSSNSDDSDGDTDTDKGENSNKNPKKKPVEQTVPKTGQNLWFQYDSQKDLDSLMEALDNQGIRESTLYTVMKERYQDIVKSINLCKRATPGLRESDGEKELMDNFKQDLMETENRLRKGGLGGVEDAEKWEEKLSNATKMKDLGALLIETQASILERFLKGIMAPCKGKQKPAEAVNEAAETAEDVEEDDDNEEQEEPTETVSKKVLRWQEAIQECSTMSRLHVLLGIMDSCIKWEKSAENAKCKICRKKVNEDKLLLCDECNQPFHLYCLRPALSAVPKGDWMCPACKPSVARRNTRGRDYAELNGDYSDSDYSDSQSDEEHDEICCVCEEDQELVLCSRCPSAYHRECHDPPLRNFPRGKWVCSPCLNSRSTRSRSKRKQAIRKKKQAASQTSRKSSKRTSTPSQAQTATGSRNSANSSIGRKRTADSDADENTRRSSGRAQRSSNDLKVCEEILNKLIRHKYSWPFRRPVELDEAPDYYDIILDPIDFQTMKNKCLCLDYKNISDFIDDIKKVFNNAEIYNKTGSEVLICKEKTEDFFKEVMETQLPNQSYKREGPYVIGSQGNNLAGSLGDHSYVNTSKKRRLEK